MRVGLHQAVYVFSPKTAFIYLSGTLCCPSMNAVLAGMSTLKARSARWWHNVHQEVLEQNFSHFFKKSWYKEVIYSVILIRSQNRAAFY